METENENENGLLRCRELCYLFFSTSSLFRLICCARRLDWMVLVLLGAGECAFFL